MGNSRSLTPKTPAQRKRKERAGKETAGLTRGEFWARPEDHRQFKALERRLRMAAESAKQLEAL